MAEEKRWSSTKRTFEFFCQSLIFLEDQSYHLNKALVSPVKFKLKKSQDPFLLNASENPLSHRSHSTVSGFDNGPSHGVVYVVCLSGQPFPRELDVFHQFSLPIRRLWENSSQLQVYKLGFRSFFSLALLSLSSLCL